MIITAVLSAVTRMHLALRGVAATVTNFIDFVFLVPALTRGSLRRELGELAVGAAENPKASINLPSHDLRHVLLLRRRLGRKTSSGNQLTCPFCLRKRAVMCLALSQQKKQS